MLAKDYRGCTEKWDNVVVFRRTRHITYDVDVKSSIWVRRINQQRSSRDWITWSILLDILLDSFDLPEASQPEPKKKKGYRKMHKNKVNRVRSKTGQTIGDRSDPAVVRIDA